MAKGPEDFERRPHPQGWVQPKAPYNPYDPTDVRPAEGYPSEFDAPSSVKKNTGKIAQDLTDYQKIKIDMKRLKYYPRPPSELYPGRYKVLRKVNHKSGFLRGAELTAKLSIYGFVGFGVFFYKWNDNENVFAPFRRFQLRVKEFLLGGLSTDDYNDVYNYKKDKMIPQRPLPTIMYEQNEKKQLVGEDATNNEFIKDRFGNKHVVYAEHITQKEEESMLKAMELAERELELKKMREGLQGSDVKPVWKFW
ncbi:DEKNAAC100142 [Brettanomyces naardenensis]|uniref:DEKNAAC100142 n=1 Tax=Brettanomyces naardenensis TaxID=13370 RepID=A0A448YFR1_BRENA|nr:DEKNAAC100142 [Brettanomyces naardenensis]